MKSRSFLLTILISIFICGNLFAQDSTQAKNKDTDKDKEFVDKTKFSRDEKTDNEDNNGYNDNAPDHDGDGIPNGLDPDWQKLQKEKKKAKRKRFVDLDGDGINDNIQNSESGQGEQVQMRQQKMQQGQDGSSIENKQQKGQGQKRQGKKE